MKMQKNVIFNVLNVTIYALFWGTFSNFSKCAGVKYLTNMMSAPTPTPLLAMPERSGIFVAVCPSHSSSYGRAKCVICD